MSEIPEGLRYTKSHEWVRVENNVAIVGITQHAQGLLGDMVFIELPEEGDSLQAGDESGVVESVKAASDVYAPLTGEVVEINADLEDSPSVINLHPYDEGWMFKITISDAEELNDLMSAEEYSELVAEET